MDSSLLQGLLASRLPLQLAQDLVAQFIQMRLDVASRTLGRSAPGKFVETIVQALQQMERGSFDKQPAVDDYLKNLESRGSTLPDGLRICAARVARSMYTLRSKRNILHKGEVDPNDFDLRFLLAGAQWIMAELIRESGGGSMQQAGTVVDQVQAPVGALVEDLGSRRIVHAKLSAKAEILVLLHSHYPAGVPLHTIVESLDRRNADAVRRAVRQLWGAKLVDGSPTVEYRLTAQGVREALAVIKQATV